MQCSSFVVRADRYRYRHHPPCLELALKACERMVAWMMAGGGDWTSPWAEEGRDEQMRLDTSDSHSTGLRLLVPSLAMRSLSGALTRRTTVGWVQLDAAPGESSSDMALASEAAPAS